MLQKLLKVGVKTTSKERSDLLRKLFGLLMENSEDLAKIITIEVSFYFETFSYMRTPQIIIHRMVNL